MRHIATALVFIAICASVTACRKNPAGPTDQPPDQSKYEPLPARHYLKDSAGNTTKMWVVLNSVSPDRGSKITTGQHPCPGDNCFTGSVTLGIDPLDNPDASASFKGGFSSDGVNISGVTFIAAGGVPQGRPNPWSFTLWFPMAPKYLVVTGEHSKGVKDPEESGSTSFVLDYRQ